MAVMSAPSVPEVAEIKPWVCRMVRLGYAAKGAIYTLIGLFAFRMAFGMDGGRVTDSSGVLHTIIAQPFGLILLALIGIGVLTYAIWHVAEAITDARRKGSDWRGKVDRALTIIKSAVYAGIGWEALRLVLGARGSSADADDYARETMQFPLGDVFLLLVGVGVAIYGALEIWKAFSARFDDDLDETRVRSEAPWVLPLGRAGISARGVIMVLIGFGLVKASLEHSAANARGLDESLWTVFAQPSGPWLLAVVAAGLMCFGIFQLLHARYARLAPSWRRRA
jgi:hypothetical protein